MALGVLKIDNLAKIGPPTCLVKFCLEVAFLSMFDPQPAPFRARLGRDLQK